MPHAKTPSLSNITPNGIYCGRFQDIIPYIEPESVQLMFTSPPYENAVNYWSYGKRVAGAEKGAMYVQEYFIGLFDALQRCLKPSGIAAVVVNDITERKVKSNAIYEGVIEICRRGWLRVETYIWLKSRATPRPPTCIQDWFEYIFLFAKNRKYKLYPHRIRRPYQESSLNRFKYLAQPLGLSKSRALSKGTEKASSDRVRQPNPNGVTMPNVIYESIDSSTPWKHPAKFPPRLAQWALTLCTDKGDVVLDPMCGSGTTLEVAKIMGRRYIGIDISKEYVDMARQRTNKVFYQEDLFNHEDTFALERNNDYTLF